MNREEILKDLIETRGAVLRRLSDVTLLGEASVAGTTLTYRELTANGLGAPATLEFTTWGRLHALCVGFFDEKGKVIALIQQTREADLPADMEQQFTAIFADTQKKP